MKKTTLILFYFFISVLCFGQKQFEHLTPTKENILLVCNYHNIQHSKYVLAQAIQECGLKPPHNNLFGLTHRRGLYKFPHWSYSVQSYKEKIQSRYRKGENYLAFLKRVKYAEDPHYTKKISKIVSPA